MHTVDGSCLDLASPTRGRILAAFSAACLQMHLASRQEKRVIIIVTILDCKASGVHKLAVQRAMWHKPSEGCHRI